MVSVITEFEEYLGQREMLPPSRRVVDYLLVEAMRGRREVELGPKKILHIAGIRQDGPLSELIGVIQPITGIRTKINGTFTGRDWSVSFQPVFEVVPREDDDGIFSVVFKMNEIAFKDVTESNQDWFELRGVLAIGFKATYGPKMLRMMGGTISGQITVSVGEFRHIMGMDGVYERPFDFRRSIQKCAEDFNRLADEIGFKVSDLAFITDQSEIERVHFAWELLENSHFAERYDVYQNQLIEDNPDRFIPLDI